jgi:redox-sensitive bicupin YhaK (pirin superfamily)
MATTTAGTARTVLRTTRGFATSDGAGVSLHRLIGTPEVADLDPFLMLDEFRSDEAQDYIAGFPNHPHRGFETVTYMLAGRMRHGDNQGNSGLLTPGSVQWMTAGRGIVHSEMPEQEDGLLWGFQLWINLPGKDKMTAPRYQDIPPEDIPVVERPDGTRVTLIAGELDGISGPVEAVHTDPRFFDIALPAGQTFDHALPAGHAAFLYVIDGAVTVAGERTVEAGTLAVLSPGERIALAAGKAAPARFILLAGRPLGEPVAKYGPFVMNTEAEIRQAIADFRAGRL